MHAPFAWTLRRFGTARRDQRAVEQSHRLVFDRAKDAVGQSGSGSEWVVFRVTDVNVPQVDMATDEAKKLRDTLQRSLTDEQVAQYVTKIENDIGTSINQAAFAQVTGAASN